jgi:diguanylate cyclase (GGDEF)-like protein/PAS domain S-box-containing protein
MPRRSAPRPTPDSNASPRGPEFARAILDRGGAAMVLVDAAAHLSWANPGAEELLGYSTGSMLDRCVLDLVHPADLGLAIEAFGTAANTGPGVKDPVELRVRDAHGVWQRVAAVATNLLDDPHVAGILLVLRRVDGLPGSADRQRSWEDRFVSAFEFAPMGRAIVSRDGRVVRVNRALAELASAPEELIGVTLTELLPGAPDPGTIVDESVQAETSVESTKHGTRWLEVTVSPMTDDHHGDTYLNVFVEDISDLRAAEARLRSTQDEFRALVAHSSDIITVLEPDGTWRSSSSAASRVLGFPPGKTMDGSIFDLLHPDDVGSAQQAFADLLEGKRGPDDALVLRVRNYEGDRWLHLETNAQDLVDHPAVRGIVLNSRDVTERVAAEAELRASQDRFVALVQHSRDLIVVLDDRGCIEYLSPAAKRLLDLDPDELRGVEGLSLVHPDDVEPAATLLLEMLAEPGATRQIQMRLRHRDGSYRTVDSIGESRLDDPAVRGVVLNIRDVTDRAEAERALRSVQERFRALVQHASDVITVVDADATISYASPSMAQVLGYDPVEVIGMNALDLIHPEDRDLVFEASAKAIADASPATVEYRTLTKSGEIRVFEAITTDLTGEPSVAGFVTNARDVTDRRAAERQAERLIEVLEKSNEVVVLSEPSGRLVYSNPRAKEFLGLGDEHDVGELSSFESRQRLREEIMPLVRTHGLWTGELTLRTSEGNDVPVIATLQAHREDSEIVLISTLAHDITDLKRAQHRLEYEATHDALTGLPNRAMFLEVGEQALGRAQRLGSTTAVLFLDLDGFKEVNDSLGHDAGDRVLVEIGRNLRVSVRTGDLVARLGGDEFCVLCENVESREEMLELGQRICNTMALPMSVHGREVKLGASIGVSFDVGGVDKIGNLLRQADVALYRAKRAGGYRVEIADPPGSVIPPSPRSAPADAG